MNESKARKAAADDRPAKSIEKLQLELRQTLNSLGCIEVVQASSRGGDIRMLCRCPDKPAWLVVLYAFLEREVGRSWYSFIGQKYMLVDGDLTAAWVLVFEAEDLDAAVQDVRKLFMDIAADNKAAGAKKASTTSTHLGTVAVPGFNGRLGSLVSSTTATPRR